MAKFFKIWKLIDKYVVRPVALILFASGALLCLLEVVRRYVFNVTFPWSTEIITCSMLFATWLYFATALTDGIHLRVTIFIKYMTLPVKKKLLIESVTDTIGLLSCLALAIWLYEDAFKFYELGTTLEDSGCPIALIYSVAGTGMILMVIGFLELIYKRNFVEHSKIIFGKTGGE